MAEKVSTTQGVTWLSRSFGVTWFVAVAAAAALFASPLQTAPAQAEAASDVGVVQTSWIEMLGEGANSDPVSMDMLREGKLDDKEIESNRRGDLGHLNDQYNENAEPDRAVPHLGN